eukprot:CAMPEP_0181197462 /NCGR_PEP_ID=MMETSP1096-20121128/16055_1 /TAXON_ID=156174 ORGANISM="Chrysochromulina ericina, Strain CCMP281" /NCGR_SAMPLE_ID=MMETSP1096 /ASSEMBLY_ACC=CAM_ASM_000453 /LENGTH=164 /DNA_ID=CAMNT_0023287377 /DNA_START=459 /DNA_END=954 /DNA_ORIENTATION=+
MRCIPMLMMRERTRTSSVAAPPRLPGPLMSTGTRDSTDRLFARSPCMVAPTASSTAHVSKSTPLASLGFSRPQGAVLVGAPAERFAGILGIRWGRPTVAVCLASPPARAAQRSARPACVLARGGAVGVEGQQRRDAAHIIAHRPRLARRLQREQPRYEGLEAAT